MRAIFTTTFIMGFVILTTGAAFAETMEATNRNRDIAKNEAIKQASLLCGLEHKEYEKVRMVITKDGPFYTAVLTYNCV